MIYYGRCPTSAAGDRVPRARWCSLVVAAIVLQAARAGVREGPVMTVTAAPSCRRLTPSTSDELGVRYNLRLTKKNTLRQTLGHDRPTRGEGEPTSGRSRTSHSGSSTANRWRSSGRTGPARARSSRPSPGSSSRPRAASTFAARSRACSTRRRLRPGADRPRQHPARRGLHGHRPRRDGRAARVDHRVRRHRPVHRRADQDLLVRDAGSARLLDRDLGRSGHPAPRRSPRHRRPGRSARRAGRASWSSSRAPRRSSS